MEKLPDLIERTVERVTVLEKETYRLRAALKRLIVLQDRESTGQSNLVKDWQDAWDEAEKVIME